MKRRILVCVVVALTFSLVYAQSSYAWHGHYSGRGGYYTAGALVGGLLLGTVIGAAVSQPRYAEPAPVYVYPSAAPVYASPAPPQAYSQENPPGEWVTVPGRWMDGRWVPAHKVWTPINPY